MKKTIRINLNGIIFNIDDDAYEKLKAYLDTISRHFSNKQESKEIITDIEARVAELFQERISADSQVVTLPIVNEVINIMGNPEDIADTGEAGESKQDFHQNYSRSKRLYRDPENSVIGGVCGGLSAYFAVDPVIFRLLFVIFFFAGGASILVYIILWIVLPQALTAAQKLEMRGEKVNVNNLEKKIREEYDNVKDNVKENVSKAKESETYKNARSGASNFFEVLGKILLVFIKVILIIVGASLLIAGIGVLIGLITLPFAGLHFFPFESYDFSLGDVLAPFASPGMLSLLVIAVSLLVLIPIGAMLYALVRLIFNIKSKSTGLGIAALVIWLVCLFGIITIVAIESSNYADHGRKTLSQELMVESDTLYVKINKEQEDRLDDQHFIDLDDWFYLLDDEEALYGKIEIDVERSSSDEFLLEIEKESKGRSRERARENAANIDYGFRTYGNTLVLDPYYSVGTDNNWRFPRVETTLRVPEGKVVVLDRETRNYLDGIRNLSHLSDWNMAGKSWLMTEDGLELLAD